MKKIRSLRGMHDQLPEDNIYWWNKIEKIIKNILINYCFHEIRLPILEKTILFKRSINNNIDIINKEMYIFNDKKGCSISLRPEATASCVRAIIQNNLLSNNILKIWYFGPMFRYERPQKGRFRQFHQFGAEIYGFKGSNIELEILLLNSKIWNKLKINDYVTLEINSIGNIKERFIFEKKLKKFFKKNIIFVNNFFKKKINNNYFRILDSKNKKIKKLLINAPHLSNFLNKKSIKNFNKICFLLKKFNIPYIINNNLIRGLDYYNNIVFEWKTKKLGTQNTICSGGRYDNLFIQLGYKKIPSLGFAIGMERLILLKKNIKNIKKKIKINIFIYFSKIKNQFLAIKLSEKIRFFFPKLKIMFSINNINKKINNYISKFDIDLIFYIGNKERKNKYINIKICKINKKKIIFKKFIFSFLNNFFYNKKIIN
ncbi:histidine--tRNA ligase [Buchnera aphidicola]|uniref:histidine--tRNA ligase n=1 Tax=Buchnera aphidicola TaxID=9 RepID=UPI0031B85B88